MTIILPILEEGQKIHITFDKSLPRTRITEFNHYVEEKASYLSFERGNNLSVDCLESFHATSVSEPCLQAVDAIAGACFQKCENSNDSYVNIIKDVTSLVYLWRK